MGARAPAGVITGPSRATLFTYRTTNNKNKPCGDGDGGSCVRPFRLMATPDQQNELYKWSGSSSCDDGDDLPSENGKENVDRYQAS